MKKLLATMLALVMALTLCTAAWADVTNGMEFPVGGTDEDVVYWSIGTADGEYGFAATLAAALNDAYKANDGTKTITVICKADADVGAMTHSHVADNLTIYGNGAKVTGGEHDLEIDTYKYDRTTGAQSETGVALDKDITITVLDLDGIAIWGERTTANTVTAKFFNCKNMNRAYITGTTGSNNLYFEVCSFDTTGGSHPNTSIYSNAAGSVTVNDTDFKGVAVPINLNNKSNGTQEVSIFGCGFTDCASAGVASAQNASTYAAPIRVLAQSTATTTLSVDDCTFTGESANGDILIGDGRCDGTADNAKVTVEVKNTAAEVQIQQAGYYKDNNGNEKVEGNTTTTSVADGQKLAISGGSADVMTYYTVTFKPDNGEEDFTQTLTMVNNAYPLASAPTAPTKGGYDFNGWYLTNTDGSLATTAFDFDTDSVTGDITLTAKWTAKPHRVINNVTTPTTDTTETKAESPKTFDAGIAVYGLMAVSSVLGMGVVGKKKF